MDKEEREGTIQHRELPAVPITPHHSRPIDVHRVSDHPEVRTLVNHLWEKHFKQYAQKSSRGPKPKTRHKDQLRVLLLDLYVAWKEDPTLSIGVHLSNTEWKTNSRYNALHLSKIIVEYVHHLAELGLLELSKGSYAGPGASTNRNARIRAAEPLQQLFREARFGLSDIHHTPERECIILRGDGEKPVEYEDTEFTIRMRADLRRYNDLLYGTFIDIPILEEPFIERPITTGPRAGQMQRIPIGPDNQFVRRVFSRGSWVKNGRFYGGWWQQIDSELRKRIHINDVPTIEVDYKGLHVAILSIEQGQPLDVDPYGLPEVVLEGMEMPQQRKYLKHLVLTAINARSEKSAYKAFRENFAPTERGKRLKDRELQSLLDAFLAKHPHLADCMFSDQGIRLMNVDSRMAERVLRLFTAKNIPLLCIHDSFIVDYNYGRALKAAMRSAASTVVGGQVDLSNNYMGLDEVPEERKQDYANVRTLDRTRGYLERWKGH